MLPLDSLRGFARRHIGPTPAERDRMLEALGAASIDALVAEVVPEAIRSSGPLRLAPAETEAAFLDRLAAWAGDNRLFRSYIGLGYSGTVTPSVILRMVLENPGWYTPYTPYQAEIAQGRLESLLNFQTMVADLTGMEVANASLLDEATAAAEAMMLLYRDGRDRLPPGVPAVCLASQDCLPQTLDVLRARAEPFDIELRVVAPDDMQGQPGVFGAVLQYPGASGRLRDLAPIVERLHGGGARVAVGADLLALAVVRPPGEMGADVVFGSAQRFGVPMGYGGPHAAFFATRQQLVRQMPGRLVGISADAHGRQAYRMALATREQHIRREKATSNICTAQALLANMAAMYAVYHGPGGLRAVASRVHALAAALEVELGALGYTQENDAYFDTLVLHAPGRVDVVRRHAVEARINFRYLDRDRFAIALDETVSVADLEDVVRVCAAAAGDVLGAPSRGHLDVIDTPGDCARVPGALRRRTTYLTQPVFNSHHSETAFMRYVRRLEQKDIGLDRSMIALGSCTMKLNPATAMLPVSWPEFSRLHPFAPADQAEGYARVLGALAGALAELTGLSAVSLQPNSGAQGEFAGLLAIRAYHRARGQAGRDVVLIPASAHGTNPASAAMAGLRVVVVASSPDGSVNLDDLRRKAATHAGQLACLMVTYPSTHGVFEENVPEICRIVHAHGGQVYMDGANMNAQVGLTSPARIGADVCHLNLHKTFAIPHGGGGPGMGPIAVAEHLAPFLPGHWFTRTDGRAGRAVSAAPAGSASILLVSYAYICLLGAEGLTEATRYAILNANYLKARLEPHYPVLYANARGRVAHELIFDLRGFKSAGITEMDVAKRLIDYGFHAPTVSFPVAGTLMVEPTESENLAELDRFCEAMIQIRHEIDCVQRGAADRDDNPLKHAPHTASEIAATDWPHPYSREEAAFPLPFVREWKFWPPVSRVNDALGDRQLCCVWPSAPAGREP